MTDDNKDQIFVPIATKRAGIRHLCMPGWLTE